MNSMFKDLTQYTRLPTVNSNGTPIDYFTLVLQEI
jgi:hypothetical protein